MISRDLKSLDQLMDGALVERFNQELATLMENVYDLRTDPNKRRRISLIFDFKPNERRDAAEMSADVKIVTAPPIPLKQTILMSITDDGHVRLTERSDQLPGQIDIEGQETPLPKVIEFEPPKSEMK